jgi:predicted aspartyl protease
LNGVTVTPADGTSSTSFYFDPKTRLVTKLSYTDTNPYQGGKAYFEGYFHDYKESGGVLYPSRVIHFMDGVQMDEVTYESVDFETEIADEIFAKPGTPETGLADSPETEEAESLPIEVPFEFSVSLIFLDVTVGDAGEPYSFILDTGAGMTCLSKELAAELKVEALGGMSAAGAGGAFEAHTAHLEELRVGELGVNDLKVMVLDLAPLASMMGRRIDGIVGYNVLNRYTTTIDIAGGTLTFARSEDELPAGEGHFSVPFEVLMGIPVVKGTVDGVTELDFLVDTGATTSVLPKAAAEELEPTQRLEGALAAGADSRPIEMALARFSTLEMGGATMDGPVFSYPLSSERVDPIGLSIDASNRGVIGTSILSNFRVTLNYDRATMVLEPVEPPEGTGLEWSGPGLTVFIDKGSPFVRSVFKGGPADGVLEVGDRILDIDGASVDGKNLEEIMSMLQGDPGTELELTIERDGVEKKVTLLRRKLL